MTRGPAPLRVAALAAGGVAAVAALKGVLEILDSHHVVQASTPLPVILLGMIIGLTYGLLAVGLVLIYRTNRIINFAHGQIGAFAAALFGLASAQWHIPYWLAFPLALGAGAATGAVAEAGVVRRLRSAPRLMSVVATLGVGQFLVIFATVINSTAGAGALYPQPAGLPVFNVGALRVTQAYSGMLFLSPVAVLVLAVFLKRGRFGLGIRAAAANPEAARLSGVFASRMSSLAWALAGTLSAFTAILTAPTQGFATADTFGPALLLRAMTAAVLARMSSLPMALAGGVALGIVEQVLLWNYPRSGLVEITLFVIILIVLVVQPRRGGRDEERGSWAAVQALRPIPRRLRDLRAIRLATPALGALFACVLLLVPAIATNSLAVSLTGILGFSIVGLSIGILTGLGGQLTLGQFAIAAIGAVVSFRVSSHTGNFPLALLCAGAAAAAASLLIGLPALRVRGLMLTVTTLGFALATPAWLLAQPWMLDGGVSPGQPVLFGRALNTGRSYFYFALALFGLALAVAHNIRRSGFGRLLVAIRDNEDNARAFTVRASLVKLQGYLVAGFVAGIGGAAYGHALANIGVNTFPASASTNLVVMTVLGGVAVLLGPVLGAVWMLGLPLLDIGNIGLAATALGALLLILWRPGGLVQLVDPVRERLIKILARRSGIEPDAVWSGGDATPEEDRAPRVAITAVTSSPPLVPDGLALLEGERLRKTFGGIVAVDNLSFRIAAGETVGLIGPNGAGKTTAFEIIGGFTRPDEGRVRFLGRDVSALSVEARARLGLIRSFQDAGLFPTMTVAESVMLALERTHPTRLIPSVFGLNAGERRKEPLARQIIASMGLDRYRDTPIQELSTGTRRITEIACLVALEPVCLLLDEPSSGIAQRETEALGLLLAGLKQQLGLTLFVIEHDMPLIMSISDRIIAMDSGRVIATGTPRQVSRNPAVVEAYLGARVDGGLRRGTPSRQS